MCEETSKKSRGCESEEQDRSRMDKQMSNSEKKEELRREEKEAVGYSSNPSI